MRDNAVSIMRVTATFMIVLCHLCSHFGLIIPAMLLNVGVEIFLLISGYLFSTKKIDDAKIFLKNRWIKICIPMYIVYFIIVLKEIMIKDNYYVLKTLPIYLFNLQGINWITRFIEPIILEEIGQLWFLTVIMLCYVFLLILKEMEKHSGWNETQKVILLLGGIIGCLLVKFGIHILYVYVFFVGYIAYGNENKLAGRNHYYKCSIVMMISIFIRLIFRAFIDNTWIYDGVVVIGTHTVLAIWICISIYCMYNKTKHLCDKICRTRIWIWLDNSSMTIYMTHYFLLKWIFKEDVIELNMISKIIIWIFSIVLFSEVIKRFTHIIHKLIYLGEKEK